MQKILISLLLFLSCFSLSAAKRYDATVVRIIDGDTIVVDMKGKQYKVRLIGIDTPESAYNDRAELQAKRSKTTVDQIVKLGKAVKSHVKKMIHKGDAVKLEYDVDSKDKYGRLLCYVYLANGKMLNEEIIKNGYALPLTIPPNVKNKSKFLSAYRSARKNKRGLWE